MENAITIENLYFKYNGAETYALQNISAAIGKGELALIYGLSGCGKTTLLKLLKPSIAPKGEIRGGIFICGERARELSPFHMASKIGFVPQNPESGIVCDYVYAEIAFGLESLGFPQAAIRARAAEAAGIMGLSDKFYDSISSLSGGQKQLVNLAAVCALRPEILLLDEPAAMLDPLASETFYDSVCRLNRDFGITVIMSAHRADSLLGRADRLIVMEGGSVITSSPPAGAVANMDRNGAAFAGLPVWCRLWGADGGGEPPCPIDLKEGKIWLSKRGVKKTPLIKEAFNCGGQTGEPAVKLKNAWYRYVRDGEDILRGLCFTARFGEVNAVMGANGAGKSTLLRVLAGEIKPLSGTAAIDIGAIYIPQDASLVFCKETLGEDLRDVCGADGGAVLRASELCGIGRSLDSHPFDVSGGERQMAALCKALISVGVGKGRVLLLDEPTKGMDALFRHKFVNAVRRLAEGGAAVIIVSHDAETVAKCADVCSLIWKGEIVAQGAPKQFFSENAYYTTSASLMARGAIDGAVTAEDIAVAIGAVIPEIEVKPPPAFEPPPQITADMPKVSDKRVTAKNVTAGEISIIAALAALASAGRAALFMLPEIKPMCAVVVCAGASLGYAAGFFVGTLSALVSNIFFGQGPWTLWQMAAYGAIGLLSAAVGKRADFEKHRLALAAFGAAMAFFVFGGIVNPMMVFSANGGQVNAALIIAAYIQGAQFDAVHAAATAFFLFTIGAASIRKLRRVAMKYGLFTRRTSFPQ